MSFYKSAACGNFFSPVSVFFFTKMNRTRFSSALCVSCANMVYFLHVFGNTYWLQTGGDAVNKEVENIIPVLGVVGHGINLLRVGWANEKANYEIAAAAILLPFALICVSRRFIQDCLFMNTNNKGFLE